jgi:peroxiredoxin
MSLRTSILLGVLLAATLAITYSSSPEVSASIKAAKDRKAAPEFSLRDAQGTELKLSDYGGKVVLLNFWATWCGPCRIEIPWFVEFENTYRDRGFAVVGVSMDEDGWQGVRPYIKQHQINYPVVLGADTVAQRYGGIESLPTTLLVDREGKIASRHVGLVSKSTYENEIGRLLSR